MHLFRPQLRVVFEGEPLPVELVAFNGLQDRNVINLYWETASELNNAGFEVQMSVGTGFQKIGYVAGHGTSDIHHHYRFSHELDAEGRYQFRLKQIDFDGSFSYSQIFASEWLQDALPIVLKVYPNPTNAMWHIELSLMNEQYVSVDIYDLLGQKMGEIFDGNLPAGRHQLAYHANNLASGVYLLQASGNQILQHKLVVLEK